MTPRRCPRDVESQRAGTRGRGVAGAAVSGWVRLPRVRPADASGSPPPTRPTRAPTALSPTRHALCSSPRVGTVSGVRPAGTCVLHTDAAPDTPALPSDTRAGPCAPSRLKHRLRGPRSSSRGGEAGPAGCVQGTWQGSRRPPGPFRGVPAQHSRLCHRPSLRSPSPGHSCPGGWRGLSHRCSPPSTPQGDGPLSLPCVASPCPPGYIPADPPLALEETVPQRLLPFAAARGSRRPVRGTVTPSMLGLQMPPG